MTSCSARVTIFITPRRERTGRRVGTWSALVLALCGACIGPAVDGRDAGSGGDDAPGTSAVGFASASATTWEGTGTWPIDVIASGAAATLAIEYTVAGTATGGGVDHQLAGGTLTFATGQTAARILVPIVNDGAAEPPETVQVTLVASAGITAGAIATHRLGILDDDDRRWPGAETVVTADEAMRLGQNLSGLSYQPAAAGHPAVLWAVKNGPSLLYRLERAGTQWAPASADGWTAGKELHYPGGAGSPDAEGVTTAEDGSTAVYVVAERDNAVAGTSRLSVLRFDVRGTGASLTASHEWNLTGTLPPVDPNLGLEGIAWIPDEILVAQRLRDDRTGQRYDPAGYPGHGAGLFLVGLENNGMIYAYALDHAGGGSQRVTSFASGHAAVMGLAFDRDSGYLWTACDDTCNGDLAITAIETNPLSPDQGRFVLHRKIGRPGAMPNVNNEDIAIVPDAECVGGRKTMVWTDDSATGGHALRADAVPCGKLF